MNGEFSVAIELSYPFNELINKNTVMLDIKEPISVKELVKLLIITYPALQRPLEKNENGDVSVLLLKGSKLVAMNQVISESCSMRLLAPLSGG
jgi:molybdopterin converting factor small subunit